MRWIPFAAAAVASSMCRGCGDSPPKLGFDPFDPAAVARAYVELNYSCPSPGYRWPYDPDYQPPTYVRACVPQRIDHIETWVGRRYGNHVIVNTRIDGSPGGGLVLVRTERGYKLDSMPPPPP
jgi:hypothetical protein